MQKKLYKNTQKGRIPLMKIKYIKKGEIGLYTNKGYIMNEEFLKSMPSQKNLKSPIILSKKYNRYKREGIRLGRGKSKIVGGRYLMYKGYRLMGIPIKNEKHLLTKKLKNLKNIIEYKNLIKKISKRYPYIKPVY